MIDPLAVGKTVQEFPNATAANNPNGPFNTEIVLQMVTAADDIAPWGRQWKQRDRQLRKFWPTENVLASAIFSVQAANSALNWELDGPESSVSIAEEILHNANFGQGWTHFMGQVTLDLLTQDNGAFIEIIRMELNSETSPVVGLSHLDAGRCVRTGDPMKPVVFWDENNKPHLMKWYQIFTLEEMPSPIKLMYGLQYSAVTRVLRAAQILRSISIFKDEKISGRNPKGIHLVSGVSTSKINDVIRQHKENADNKGAIRYSDPVIIASLDPSEAVSNVFIELAGLPDNFDEETTMKWYIAELALGFGRDYQDFAPLPGGGLGSSSQSEVLERKSRGKGPGLFMKMIAHAMNRRGILPPGVSFHYDEPDAMALQEAEDVKRMRGERVGKWVERRVIDDQAARQILNNEGDIPDEILERLGDTDLSSDVSVTDNPEHRDEDYKSKALDHREEPSIFARANTAYQDEIVGIMRSFIDKTEQEIDGLSKAVALTIASGRVQEVRDQMINLGGERIPEAWRMGKGVMPETSNDRLQMNALIEDNTKWVNNSLIPFIQQRVEEAIFASVDGD